MKGALLMAVFFGIAGCRVQPNAPRTAVLSGCPDGEGARGGGGPRTNDAPSSGGIPASLDAGDPMLNPDRALVEVGFRQRRAAVLFPEDPLILEWLKRLQDVSSPEQQLLPSIEGNQAHTFNNAVVAMAFLLKGEKERSERILDYYAQATHRENGVKSKQNFFYRGEPRGFYQSVRLNADGKGPAYHDAGSGDRWMGDMAWLLMAYKYHEQRYGPGRYEEIVRLLLELLIAFYRQAADGEGGYVQHGWRNGDAYRHEDHGHPEGNIDCYAAFMLCERPVYAEKVRSWLERTLRGRELPLDLYSWRVLAFGSEAAHLLDIPEYDPRFRKTVVVNGGQAAGFFHAPDAGVTNIWLDGTAHMACGYLHYGDWYRGAFYANQLDAFIKERRIGGMPVHVLPYTANRQGGYEWVPLEKGFISVGAWYLFAKNGFNPMRLERKGMQPSSAVPGAPDRRTRRSGG